MKLVPPTELPNFGITLKNNSRRTLEGQGKFPKRVQITERSHAYIETELVEYCKARIAERDAKLGGEHLDAWMDRELRGQS